MGLVRWAWMRSIGGKGCEGETFGIERFSKSLSVKEKRLAMHAVKPQVSKVWCLSFERITQEEYEAPLYNSMCILDILSIFFS